MTHTDKEVDGDDKMNVLLLPNLYNYIIGYEGATTVQLKAVNLNYCYCHDDGQPTIDCVGELGDTANDFIEW